MTDKRYEILCHRLVNLLRDDCGRNMSADHYLPFIIEAECDLCNYLHMSRPLAEEFEPKVVELARLRVMKANASVLKSRTYTEGSVSESETYITASDLQEQEKDVFDSLSTHRRCRIVKA